ncbi:MULTISPECIES: DUF6153 family protein [unclassified Streptomyces]|uniref:DUF6153 family protein n=1 Tax=unclassified Streptomyces TaxID=2593676 RepID=UPI003825FAAD
MTARAQRTDAAPPAPWRRALLVLALLAGLFAMHALAPGGTTTHPMNAMNASPSAHLTRVTAPDDCVGSAHGNGHVQHADQMCASGAVPGGPTLPALLPGQVTALAPADAGRPYAVTAPDGARAPPSLAELQLLRI